LPPSPLSDTGQLLAPCILQQAAGDDKQLLTTSSQVTGAAPVVDIALLSEEAITNVGNGVAALPNWRKLTNLSQLIVEIDFENNSVAIEPKSYRRRSA
jgi:hypothetical protein